MIVYGRNPVKEALRGRRATTLKELWVTKGAAREPWLEGLELKSASADEIEDRCGSGSHQGICARVGDYPYVSHDQLLDRPDVLLVALDEIQDPQNLGSICRTAECAGAAGVVIPERRSVQVTPAVCKASAGAVEHLPIARVRNLADFLMSAQKAGFWCYGASAEDDAVDYRLPDYRGPVVLVLGSEGKGVRPRVASSCDRLVRLPMRGRIQSLGVSAAAAALMYEILHAQGAGA